MRLTPQEHRRSPTGYWGGPPAGTNAAGPTKTAGHAWAKGPSRDDVDRGLRRAY